MYPPEETPETVTAEMSARNAGCASADPQIRNAAKRAVIGVRSV
jgi:hypothetical protein